MDELVGLVLRPPRMQYSVVQHFGPTRYAISPFRPPINRTDFTVMNERGLKLVASIWYAGELIPTKQKQQNRTCVVYCHGAGSSRLDAISDGCVELCAMQYGLAVIAFDFAGSGQSEPSASATASHHPSDEYITLGYREPLDVVSVISHAVRNWRFYRFAIWGRSMGAVTAVRLAAADYPTATATASHATAASAPAPAPAPPVVANRDYAIVGLICDSPFSHLWTCIGSIIAHYKTNSVAKAIAGSIALPLVRSAISDRITGFDIKEFDICKSGVKCRAPALFLHASGDQFVLPDQSKALFDSYGIDATASVSAGTGSSAGGTGTSTGSGGSGGGSSAAAAPGTVAPHKQYVLIPGGSHNSVRPRSALTEISHFIYTHILSSANDGCDQPRPKRALDPMPPDSDEIKHFWCRRFVNSSAAEAAVISAATGTGTSPPDSTATDMKQPPSAALHNSKLTDTKSLNSDISGSGSVTSSDTTVSVTGPINPFDQCVVLALHSKLGLLLLQPWSSRLLAAYPYTSIGRCGSLSTADVVYFTLNDADSVGGVGGVGGGGDSGGAEPKPTPFWCDRATELSTCFESFVDALIRATAQSEKGSDQLFTNCEHAASVLIDQNIKDQTNAVRGGFLTLSVIDSVTATLRSILTNSATWNEAAIRKRVTEIVIRVMQHKTKSGTAPNLEAEQKARDQYLKQQQLQTEKETAAAATAAAASKSKRDKNKKTCIIS